MLDKESREGQVIYMANMAGKTSAIEKQATDGSMALASKPSKPQVITIEATQSVSATKLRVAAYVRVSSASEDQLNSFEAQRRYYTGLIAQKDAWKLVDIYADEGITGTSAQKRPDFQRLLADCHRGLVDRVLVKSISRFARNTAECLETIRELKRLGVSVYFEKENIDTATMSGEMLTTIFAAIAQAESKSISGNMRWSYQKRMESGKFVPPRQPYGYQLVNGRISISENRARIIRQIFQDYLAGISTDSIAKRLEDDSRSALLLQERKWNHVMILSILKNEKYAGNSCWQKFYTTDTFPHEKRRNNKNVNRYFAENTHPAIIDHDTFDRVQQLLTRRSAKTSQSITAQTSPFRGLVCCGHCGSTFRWKEIRGVAYRICRSHVRAKDACPILPIPESELTFAFLRLYYNLKHHGSPILQTMLQNLTTIRERQMLWSIDILTLNREISDLSSQLQMLAVMRQQGLIDPDIHIAQSNAVTGKLRTAKQKKEQLLQTDADTTLQDTQDLLDILEESPDVFDAFDADIFNSLVEKIIVESNEKIRFRLRNGLELVETIERTVR